MSMIQAVYPGDAVMLGVAIAIGVVCLLTSTALVVAHWLRRPTTRHTLLLAALVCSLATPLVAVAIRGCGISTMTWTLAARELSSDAHGGEAPMSPATGGLVEVRITRPPGAVPDFEGQPEETAELRRWESPARRATIVPEVAPTELSGLRRALAGAMIVWLAVGAALLARVALQSTHMLRLRRSCRAWAADSSERILADVRRALAVDHLPPILICDQTQSPFAAGVFRGAVILPAGLVDKIEPDQLCDVLVHECAHVVRRDPLVRYLQAIAGTLFWPLPTMHLVNWQLGQAREAICDNNVLAGREPSLYGETLLAVATLVGQSGPSLAVVGILPGRGSLEARIAALLDRQRSKATLSSRLGMGFCLAVLLLASIVACGTTTREAPARPAAESKDKAPQTFAVAVLPQANSNPSITPEIAAAEEAAAERTVKLIFAAFQQGQLSGPEEQYIWSRRLMDAQFAKDPTPDNRRKAAEGHAERMKQLNGIAVALLQGGQGLESAVAMTQYYLADAEALVKAAEQAAGVRAAQRRSPTERKS